VRGAAALLVRAVEADRWLGSDTCCCFEREVAMSCAEWGCTTLRLVWLSCVPKNIKRQYLACGCTRVDSLD
jgi:hypothetical protein